MITEPFTTMHSLTNRYTTAMVLNGKSGELLRLELLDQYNHHILEENINNSLSILWVRNYAARLKVDGEELNVAAESLICFTEFHAIEVVNLNKAWLLQFNHPFCCIKDIDEESPRGLLFYTASQVPVINLPEKEIAPLESRWRLLGQEMNTHDSFQNEMLQIILKRLIIFCSRLFKSQKRIAAWQPFNLEVIRDFNYLVEIHFREKHAVGQYADLLNKSSKTISNLFAQYNQKTPLQIIQDRVLLEARRLLLYTDKSIKEIAFEIGYKDIQTFSRFFRTKAGVGPKEFRIQALQQEELLTL